MKSKSFREHQYQRSGYVKGIAGSTMFFIHLLESIGYLLHMRNTCSGQLHQ